eukprot:2639262-Pyramimonas_sp.AAC.1
MSSWSTRSRTAPRRRTRRWGPASRWAASSGWGAQKEAFFPPNGAGRRGREREGPADGPRGR